MSRLPGQPPNPELLRHVARPARYTGGEWGSIRKPWDEVSVRVCLAYPDTYENGALRPSVNSVYSVLNAMPDVLAERVFAPWPDCAGALRSSGGVLASLESQRPIADFDVVAMCYPDELAPPTVLEMLDLAGVPIEASEREDRHPLIVGWEEEPKNPEPLAAFLDVYLVGDVEVAMGRVLDTMRTLGSGRPNRSKLLGALAGQSGVYVPVLYATNPARGTEASNGAARTTPRPIKGSGAGDVVRRVVWQYLTPSPVGYLVPHLQATLDRPVVETSRGCSTDCEAMELGLHSGPLRHRPSEAVVDSLRAMLRGTGFQEIALGGTCLHERPDSVELVRAVREASHDANAQMRLPQLAPAVETADILRELGSAKQNIAIGPIVLGVARNRAGGNERDWMDPIAAAIGEGSARGGIGNVRFTVALGHSMEDSGGPEADATALSRMIRSLPATRGQVRVTAEFVIPRAFTPLERVGQKAGDELAERAAMLKGTLGRKAAPTIVREVEIAQVEASIARGGREVAEAIRHAWKLGCHLDGAEDAALPNLWRTAFAEAGMSLEAQAMRGFGNDEALPWSHLAGWREPLLIDEIRMGG